MCHLVEFFEFLHGSRIICLSFNISKNCDNNIFSKRHERQRLIAFIFVNMIQYPRILKNNIDYLSKPEPRPFFHSDINSVLGHVLVHSAEKTHVLTVTVEVIRLLFLNLLCFNFASTPNKSLMFTRFRRSFVNIPVVILTNHCQSYAAFFLDVRCSKWPRSIFLQLFVPLIVHLRNLFLLSTPVARMLLTSRWVSRQKDMK